MNLLTHRAVVTWSSWRKHKYHDKGSVYAAPARVEGLNSHFFDGWVELLIEFTGRRVPVGFEVYVGFARNVSSEHLEPEIRFQMCEGGRPMITGEVIEALPAPKQWPGYGPIRSASEPSLGESPAEGESDA